MSEKSFRDQALPFISLCFRYKNTVVTQHSTDASQASLFDISKELDAQLQQFDRSALRISANTTVANIANYLLCAFADEILSEKLGFEWMRNGMLVRHHNESHGGDKCWHQLNQLLTMKNRQYDSNQLQLLALYEVVIACGFRGKYKNIPQGELVVYKYRKYLHSLLINNNKTADARQHLLANASHHLLKRKVISILPLVLGWCIILLILVWFVDHELQTQWNVIQKRMSDALFKNNQPNKSYQNKSIEIYIGL